MLYYACASTPDIEDIKSAEAHNKIGYSYLNDGQLNEALIEYQKSYQMNPRNIETLNYLGYINSRFNKYDEAIYYYKRALAVDPDYSEVLNNLGVAYVETGKWDEAIKNFNAALKNPVYGTPVLAYSNMGYAYYKKGDYQNAKKALDEALMRNPAFPQAMYVLGLVYAGLGNDSAAIEEFRKAIGILPDYTDVHWALAKTYLRTGMKAKAMKHFKIVAEKDENSDRGREALEYIERLKY